MMSLQLAISGISNNFCDRISHVVQDEQDRKQAGLFSNRPIIPDELNECSPSIARQVLTRMQQIPSRPGPDYSLTSREKEVLACVVNGLSYSMIADYLFISYDKVKNHIKKVYAKLQLASMAGMQSKAI